MREGIDTLLFDLGGVLIDLDKQACIDAYKALGFSNVDDYLNEYEQQGVFRTIEDGSATPAQFRQAIRQEIGREVSDIAIDDAFCQFLLHIPLYKLEMLRALKSRYRIVMLSNTNPIMFERICQSEFTQEGLTIDAYFDHLFLSYEMGCYKPNPLIFEKMIASGIIDPHKTLYVEDAAANLEAARPFGFDTLLVKPREDFRTALGL